MMDKHIQHGHKKLEYVIFDIDDTCIYAASVGSKVHESYESHIIKFAMDQQYDEEDLIEFNVVVRPKIRKLFDYLNKNNVRICVWSAGQRPYIDQVIPILFPYPWLQPYFVMTADTIYDDTVDGKKSVGRKPLNLITQTMSGINNYNTLLIDDNPDTYAFNHSNAVRVEKFSKRLGTGNDTVIDKLIEWIETNSDSHLKGGQSSKLPYLKN